ELDTQFSDGSSPEPAPAPAGVDRIHSRLAVLSGLIEDPAHVDRILRDLRAFGDPTRVLDAAEQQHLRAVLDGAMKAIADAGQQNTLALLRDSPAVRARVENTFDYVQHLRHETAGNRLLTRALAEDAADDRIAARYPALQGTPRNRDELFKR